jgi:hypothetical protein
MSLETCHPEYQIARAAWARCRDTAAGQEAVRAAGPDYLPRLAGQSPAEYAAYLGRTLFYNAVARTVDGLSGLIFRRPPVVEVPPALADDFIADVTLAGSDLLAFAEMAVEEVLVVGRAGILVDFPRRPAEAGQSLADDRTWGMRPVWRLYRAENVINWRSQMIGGVDRLTLLVLRERVPAPSHEFDTSTMLDQYRVLDMTPEGCRLRLFIPGAGNQAPRLSEEVYPLCQGRPLDRIPFVFLGQRDTTPQVDKPPLLDLVELNLAHYRLSADYYHGLHFTGLPQPVISGVSQDEAPMTIGSSEAWLLPDPAAQAFYLEYSGQGLDAMRQELEALEDRMARLGSRTLAAEKRSAETAETALIHRAGESGTLASLAQAVSTGLSRALEMAGEWAGAGGPALCQLNTDYHPTPLSADELEALVTALQAGAISNKVFAYRLRKGEFYPPGHSESAEQDLLAAQNPVQGEVGS